MKGSDYIVEFLIKHKITDVFGYPGGSVAHLMDSFDKYRGQITAHVNYHEQACAMAACGWAEITGLPGVAYATTGPGATNLLTGIACAYFDSLPCIFITGQVNTYEQKGNLRVRQKGFQECDVVSIMKPVTKAAIMVKSASELPQALENAYDTAMEGRRGPVLLDIPMDVTRGEVSAPVRMPVQDAAQDALETEKIADEIITALQKAKRPVILAGHGIALSRSTEVFRAFVSETGIPVVTSMISVDALPTDSPYCYGMIGAYGKRWANYIINHSDCILSLGSRLDTRQTGVNTDLFAQEAVILRIDADRNELEKGVGKSERTYCALLQDILPVLLRKVQGMPWGVQKWNACCSDIRAKLEGADRKEPGNAALEEIGAMFPDNITITADVGQNQVWLAHSLPVKKKQRVLFSGGHGAMGYSLPAAIGAAIATAGPVVCVTGDGGLQMNIQELQFLIRERLPVKIVLLNNHALGMIHHFQEMYFESNFMQTDGSKGFTVPDFSKIMSAYGIRVVPYSDKAAVSRALADDMPAFIEIALPQNTFIFPKLGMNKPIHEQEPPLPTYLTEAVSTIYESYLLEDK